jgi:hypothetical protein
MKFATLARAAAAATAVTLAIQVASGDCWYGGRRNLGIVNAYYDASVINYSGSSNYNYEVILDEARESWGGISANVSITRTYTLVNDPDKYYVGEGALPNVLGMFSPYRRVSGIILSANLDDNWHYCTVSLYDNEIEAANLSYEQCRSSVGMHEIGHTLKLAHPPDDTSSGDGTQRQDIPVPPGEIPVMHRSAITDYSATPYDQQELTAKWGG